MWEGEEEGEEEGEGGEAAHIHGLTKYFRRNVVKLESVSPTSLSPRQGFPLENGWGREVDNWQAV